jgi:hypothetical protein
VMELLDRLLNDVVSISLLILIVKLIVIGE